MIQKQHFFGNCSVNFNLVGCDINPDDISGFISVDEIDFFDKITEFGLGTSIIGMINLGMILHKKSLITIFGHKHRTLKNLKFFIRKVEIFT